jgi:hypothetical protein
LHSGALSPPRCCSQPSMQPSNNPVQVLPSQDEVVRVSSANSKASDLEDFVGRLPLATLRASRSISLRSSRNSRSAGTTISSMNCAVAMPRMLPYPPCAPLPGSGPTDPNPVELLGRRLLNAPPPGPRMYARNSTSTTAPPMSSTLFLSMATSSQ